MTKLHKKKLIEVALPLEAINAASAREKSIRHGHPSTLHLWWARRPLAACRAVLFAQLVNDPSGYVDELLSSPESRNAAEEEHTKRMELWEKHHQEPDFDEQDTTRPTLEDCAVDLERRRLFKIIEDLVQWKNSTNEEVLSKARSEIRRSCKGDLPTIYDPFSGGGSIPLEAQRLGLPAFGSDLNPVAVMIGKAMIEIPSKFKDLEPTHPESKERNHYRYLEGLSEDIKFYGRWMRDLAYKQVGDMYPQVTVPKEYGGKKATVIAWIWSRTVPSPDPAFADVNVPIASSFLLGSKKGKEAWINPIVDKGAKSIKYEIKNGGAKDEHTNAKQGTKAGRGTFRCLLSGDVISSSYIRQQAAEGKMGQELIAIVAEGKGRRIYLPPQEEHIAVATMSGLRRAADEFREKYLQADTPARLTGGTCHAYGLDKWGKLFTDRQVTCLKTFVNILQDVWSEVRANAKRAGLSGDDRPLRDGGRGATAYADSICVYLSFAIDRSADRGSTICSWDSSPKMEALRNTFARQALPMTWDFAEGNPFSTATGNFINNVDWVANAVQKFVPSNSGSNQQHDAQTVPIPDDAVISTDPPYYDNIGYADLSDFFYCWMRPSLAKIFPELFGVLVTPKSEELVATSYRHGGRQAAEQFFLAGMGRAISNLAQHSSSEIPATIYYAFKQSEIAQEGVSSTGWATFLQAVIEAGYSVVGTWPMRTEMANRMIAAGTNALANSVVLVCRKRGSTAETVTRAEFVRTLRRELPSAISELQAASIAPADMPQSAIGPGMGVFSRFGAVLEADDSPMMVKSALQLINRELDEYLGGIQGEFDAETRFAISWFEQNGMGAGEYGTANNIATARGVSVESVKHAGIVESSAGSVRILARDELDKEWDPNKDPHLTIWECLQYLVRQHQTDGISYDTAILLRKIGDNAEAVKDLAYCLYDISANKRQDAREANAYNALIADWTELTREAASTREIPIDGQASMDI